MPILSKESLLAHLARPVVKIDVEALGEEAFMREMSAGERAALYKRFFPNDKASDEFTAFDWNVALVCATLSDEQGHLLLIEADAKPMFTDGRAAVLDALVQHANRINGMGADAAASAEKNSAQTTSDGSSSTSPTA